jgi:hypothetical protein
MSIKRIAAVFVAAAMGFSWASAGMGAPPDKFDWIEEFGEPGVFSYELADCGDFEAIVTVEIAGFWMTHYPQGNGNGNGKGQGQNQWEFYHSAQGILVENSDDPSIFVEGIPGNVMNRHWQGVAFDSDRTETGVQMMITLPGYGVIYRDVGRILIDWDTFEAEFLAGHWDSWDEDFAALCDALSP